MIRRNYFQRLSEQVPTHPTEPVSRQLELVVARRQQQLFWAGMRQGLEAREVTGRKTEACWRREVALGGGDAAAEEAERNPEVQVLQEGDKARDVQPEKVMELSQCRGSYADSDVAATTTIYVKLVKAGGLREHLGRAPTASMRFRVVVGGHAQEQVLRSKGVSASHSPHWLGEITCGLVFPAT